MREHISYSKTHDKSYLKHELIPIFQKNHTYDDVDRCRIPYAGSGETILVGKGGKEGIKS
jgi:hypothetical protein